MFWHFYQNPRAGGEVYNAGGGRYANCSMLEAIDLCELITGNKMNYTYTDDNRSGDHVWYISDVSKFKSHFPEWDYQYSLEVTMQQIFENLKTRLRL
jgi:CDP-paratose 2-epimerase